jgi:phosphoribosyl-ATP pyrophosphohydrolase
MTHPLDALWQVIEARANDDPAHSYSAKLLREGLGRIAQKVGEEAVETAIAAARLEAGAGTARIVASESADLLYHLLVLWKAAGLTPADVHAILEERRGTSGIEEKNSRGQPSVSRNDSAASTSISSSQGSGSSSFN